MSTLLFCLVMEPERGAMAEDRIAVVRRGGFMEMLEAAEVDVGGLLDLEVVDYPMPLSVATLYGSPSSERMLCFGGGEGKKAGCRGGGETTSSTSSSSGNTGPSKHKKAESKEGRSGNAPKKLRRQSTAPDGGGTPKVRKERIGDRVIALQQLVSPFGKSDTASVLHEALGYIKFLHDQVQVLSSPYLQQLQPSVLRGSTSDLRSRGLCLVPVSCTTQLESSNGADLWSAVTKH